MIKIEDCDYMTVLRNGKEVDYENVSDIECTWDNINQLYNIQFDCLIDGIKYHVVTVGTVVTHMRRLY